MKKKAAAILITAMALNLVACSSSNTSNTTTAGQDTAAAENADTTEAAEEGDSEATEGEGLKIAFFMYENSNTFTTYIRLGLENYGAEHNVTVESFDGRSDQATQTDGITAALLPGNMTWLWLIRWIPAQVRPSIPCASRMEFRLSMQTALRT